MNLVAGGLLAAGGFAIGDWILSGLGVMTLLFSGTGFKIARLGRRLRHELPDEARSADDIPDSLLAPLSERVTSEILPANARKPKLIAQYLDMVWQNVHNRPPRAAATLALLGVYVFALIGVPIVGITAMVVGQDEVVVEGAVDGESPRKLSSLWGTTQWETELDEEGAFHGRYTEYGFFNEELVIAGTWAHGFRDGCIRERPMHHRDRVERVCLRQAPDRAPNIDRSSPVRSIGRHRIGTARTLSNALVCALDVPWSTSVLAFPSMG